MHLQRDLTVAQILDMSLRREQQAHDFYEGLAATCSVVLIRELLDRLRDEESKHVSMIQKMQMRLELGKDVLP